MYQPVERTAYQGSCLHIFIYLRIVGTLYTYYSYENIMLLHNVSNY